MLKNTYAMTSSSFDNFRTLAISDCSFLRFLCVLVLLYGYIFHLNYGDHKVAV